MSAIVRPDRLVKNRHYLLRMIDPIYETRIVFEVIYIDYFSGDEYDIENDTTDLSEIRFEKIPYSSKVYYENYDIDDYFGLFEVVGVVETRNVPLDLLLRVPYNELEYDTRRMFEELFGYTYTESEYLAVRDLMRQGIMELDDYNYSYKNIDKPGELIWVRLTDNPNLTIMKKERNPFVFSDRETLRKSVEDYLKNPSDSPPIYDWDVRGVLNMSNLFISLIQSEEHNELLTGIENWDVSNVRNMFGMFSDCTFFNQPLNGWNLSSVEDTRSMFYRCHRFNHTLNNWRMPIIQKMDQMFHYCTSFDQDLNSWNISPMVSKNKMFDNTLMKKRNHLPFWYEPITIEPEYEVYHASIPTYSPTDISRHQSEIDSFLSTFVDYPHFIYFINTFVSDFSPNEYEAYYSKLSPLYFIYSSPTRYRITRDNIPVEVLKSNPREPFYAALRYIFKIIPHFSPSYERDHRNPKSTSEHSYMVHLNRLIYYYNLLQLFKDSDLKRFENTGCVVIFAHGSYIVPIEKRNLEEEEGEGSLENIFVCSKAAMGCFATCPVDMGAFSLNSARDGELLDDMYESINVFSSVPFDEVLSKKYGSQDVRAVSGSCRSGNYLFGGPMQHYIGPNKKGYLNKSYSGSITDTTCFIIDVERFHDIKGDYRKPLDRLMASNLLMNPDVNVVDLQIENGKITSFNIQLSDIVDYYSNVVGKKNLFIYDTSCGTFADDDYVEDFKRAFVENLGEVKEDPLLIPFEEHITGITDDLASEGWGKKRRRATTKKRSKSIRIHIRKTKKPKRVVKRGTCRRRRLKNN
jgi:hypothetical protein